MKKYCIFAVVAGFILLIAGSVLSGLCSSMGYDVDSALNSAGFRNSSSPNIDYTSTEISFDEDYDGDDDNNSYSVHLGDSENLKGVSIDIPVAEILVSNGYELSVYADEVDSAKFSCAINDDGILEIKYDNSFLKDKVHISEDGIEVSDFEIPNISVCLPENIMLSNVSVTTQTGSLYFSGITTETLTTVLSAGNLDINCVNVNESSDISMTAGNTYIDSCILNNFNISITAGDLYADETRLTGTAEINSLAGDTTLNLQGSAEEYTFDIAKFAGEVTVDDGSVPSTSGSNTLKINKTAGDCEINFYD